MQCTQCGSTSCESNHLDADGVRGRLNSKGAPGWFTYGCWAAAHIVNIDRQPWVCLNCGNKF